MAGYEIDPTTYHLDFADAGMPGLVVSVHAPPLGILADAVGKLDGDVSAALQVFESFAGYLVKWNITSGGKPVPATYAGMLTLETPVVIKIIRAWVNAMADVDPTSPASSANGATSAETAMSIPVEPLPAS